MTPDEALRIGPAKGGSDRPRHRDLKIRTLSALALITLGFIVIAAGGWVYALWIGVVGVVIAFEWGPMIGAERRAPATLLHGGGAALTPIVVVLAGPAAGLAMLGAVAVFVAVLAKSRRSWAVAGVAYALIPQIAFILLRETPEPFFGDGLVGEGLRLTAGLFIVVGVTDTASLIIGRGIGGPRLPAWISEGKTWSGLLGGAVAGAAGGALYGAIVFAAVPIAGLSAAAVCAACATQAGDIAESILKRHFGVKDVGRLIPGHGGAMDRFDGALFAAPTGALIALLF